MMKSEDIIARYQTQTSCVRQTKSKAICRQKHRLQKLMNSSSLAIMLEVRSLCFCAIQEFI